MTDKILDKEN